MTAMEAADFFADLTYVLLPITIAMGVAAIGARIGSKRFPDDDLEDEEWMWRIK